MGKGRQTALWKKERKTPPVPPLYGGKPASLPFRGREALRTWAGGDTHRSHGLSRRVRGPRQARLERQTGGLGETAGRGRGGEGRGGGGSEPGRRGSRDRRSAPPGCRSGPVDGSQAAPPPGWGAHWARGARGPLWTPGSELGSPAGTKYLENLG